ncbi:hypothetical protein LXJ15735_28790 [Lacrimispora xylanolytica]
MAKCGVTNVAGGGGIGSDEISVTKEYVLNSKTYVGADTDDEIGTGTMPNNGTTANQSLNAGGSFYIKKGYHAQDFTVIANSLASQTSGTAIPSHVLNGETYWTNGNKVTGTMNVQSILSFSCAPYSFSQIIFTWQNPSKGPFSGVIIVGKTGGYPASINDGTWYYKGFGNNTNSLGMSNAVVGGFTVNTTYYFRAFSYTVINGTDSVSGTTWIANATIQQVTQVITSSTTWTVPSGINQVQVFLVGGGGGGGYNVLYGGDHAGFGGGSGYTTTQTVSVTPGQQIPIVIGAGGRGRNSDNGDNGSNTSFGSVVVNGGNRGSWYIGSNVPNSNGGSGGGAGGIRYENYRREQNGGNGGADGSNGNPSFFVDIETGESGWTGDGGRGQGTTTRAFGESWNTLYAGAGGGGGGLRPSSGSSAYFSGSPGQGGSGGGGRGNTSSTADIGDATPNTGGGGGGAGPTVNYNATRYTGAGGSGICILRYIG